MVGRARVRDGSQERVVRRAPGLVTQFAVIALVMTVALGIALSSLLERSVRDRAISDAERTATVAAEVGIVPALDADHLLRNFAPLDAGQREELGRRVGTVVAPGGITRFKVWNLQHWIVYSDNELLWGRWFPGNPLLEATFRGEIGSEITDLSAPEEMEEESFGEMLAVYVPLRTTPDNDGDGAADVSSAGTGEILGSFEIYLPYAPIAAAIASDTRELQIMLAVGLALLYLAVFRLVLGASRKLRRQAEENVHQALHDGLTGLANRALFNDRVDRALALAKRDGTDIALMIVDLDRFKEINDTLGHHHGDELLVQVGRRLSERLRWSDSVARLGGDEFAILLPRITSVDDARLVALEIHRLLEEPFPIAGMELDVHGSVGVAVSPHHGDDPATLLQHADIAMYVAKRSHTRVEVYDAAQDFYSPERLELAAELRDAIDDGQLVLHYQPKVDSVSREVVGVEALVRWAHPTRGVLGPGAFLPAVEHTELMRPLTEFVIEESVAQAARWRDLGWDVPVAVNLAARTVGDEALPDWLLDLVVRHGLPPHSLELELTESGVLADPDRAKRVLERAQAHGFEISIDDFGSGYASVAYLTQLPIHTVKIDQQFVRPMLDDPQAASIVRFTLDLATSLGLVAVAEGVEDEALAARLTEMGCDVLQGYGIRRPAPAGELTDFLARHARAWGRVAS